VALETMKDVKEINGEEVKEVADISIFLAEAQEEFRYIIHDQFNGLYFKIQNGPIREVGKNGCQVEDMVAVAKHIVEQLNAKFPCRENAMMITKLDEAIMWSKKRTTDRQARNVEGQSKE